MRLLDVTLHTDTPLGVPAGLTGSVTLTASRSRFSGPDVTLPGDSVARIVDGVMIEPLLVPDLPLGVFWVLVIRHGSRTVLRRNVLFPAGEGSIDLADLTRVDPETFEPEADPEAAWWAVIDGTIIDAGLDAQGRLVLTRYDGSILGPFTFSGGGGPGAVLSVAGRVGEITLGQADVEGLVAALAAKSSKLTGVSMVRGTDAAGVEIEMPYTSGTAVPGTIPIRDSNGRLQTNNPAATGDAVNKFYVDTADNLKANLASPTFTGSPKVPTAAAGTNTTQAASTAFVAALGATKADLVGGVIPTSQIPSLALVNVVPVASQAAMLALTATQVQPGDVAVRSDGAGSFILTATDPSVLSSWTRLNAPSDAVTLVNGQAGAVVLGKADIGLPLADNTSDANKPVSTAQQTALDAKADKLTAASVLYATTAAGLQTSVPFSEGFLANSIPLRNASSQISTNTPTSAIHAANKAYADTKGTKLTGPNQVMATNSSSVEGPVTLSPSATAGTIVQRTGGGVTDVGTPVSDANATTKKYVDDADALKAPLASPAFTGTPTGITKAHVGLPKVQDVGVYTLGLNDPATGIPAGSIILRGPIV
jgi:hypothetical protein